MNTNLWERIRDWVLLFVLIAASVLTMLSQNTNLMQGMRAQVLEANAFVESGFAWLGRFVRALDENSRLRQENILLASEVARSREALSENERLRELLILDDSTAAPMLAVRIVSKDINPRNFFLIDAGRRDSVEIGMAVIGAKGILGKVVLVSEHYAKVMSYLNTDFRVPAKVQETLSDGIVYWEGERADQLLMAHVVKTEPVESGQSVVTSGFSATFPAGLPIGVIDSVDTRPGRSELEIHIRPSTSISSASHAFVLRYRPDPERIATAASPVQ